MKDLNYRLNLSDADVRHLLSLEPAFQGIPTLLQFDQVRLLIVVSALDGHTRDCPCCS
jgi:hypothetical protein